MSESIRQFLRFITIGVVNTLLNYAVFLYFLFNLGFQYTFSGAVGFLSGAITGYVFNRSWTFKSQIPLLRGGMYYFFIQLLCLIVHIGIQDLAVIFLESKPMYSQFWGIIVTTCINFYLARTVLFKEQFI